MIQLFVCGIAIGLCSVGCSSETDYSTQKKGTGSTVIETELDDAERMLFKKETSLLVGRLLANKDVMDEVLLRMREVSADGELVSFAYLLGKDKGIRKSEKLPSKTARKNSLFAQALKVEIEGNKADYPIIDRLTAQKKVPSVRGRLALDLDPFTSQNLQIYSPYNEVNGYPEIRYKAYYTSEQLEDGSPTNSGYYFNGVSESYVSSMNNNLIDTNPSFIISTIDACDIVGGVCNTKELFTSAFPPPLTTVATLLTYSVDHSNITEEDILTTRIPSIKIKGTDYMEFGGTHQKLRIFRGTVEGGITQNADATASITGLKYQVGTDVRTKRKNVRKENWVTFDTQFDPDWNQSETTQQLVVFSLHKLVPKAKFSGKVDYSVKPNEKGELVSTQTPTGSATVEFTEGSAKFRANVELPRRQVLSTITGVASTGKTQNDGGIEYNVKTVGIIDFYFKHWYTDLNGSKVVVSSKKN
jgi:hypothetical protein